MDDRDDPAAPIRKETGLFQKVGLMLEIETGCRIIEQKIMWPGFRMRG